MHKAEQFKTFTSLQKDRRLCHTKSPHLLHNSRAVYVWPIHQRKPCARDRDRQETLNIHKPLLKPPRRVSTYLLWAEVLRRMRWWFTRSRQCSIGSRMPFKSSPFYLFGFLLCIVHRFCTLHQARLYSHIHQRWPEISACRVHRRPSLLFVVDYETAEFPQLTNQRDSRSQLMQEKE